MKSLLLAGLIWAANPATETLSAEQVERDIAIAREALETIHPGYARYQSRAHLDGLWTALESAAAQGMSVGEFYLQVSHILAEIRCDHTKAEFPDAIAAYRQEAEVHLPFSFRIFANRMYVDNPGESELLRGEEILSIDGISPAERFAAIRPYMPVDGYTDHVRDNAMTDFGEFMATGFEQFDTLLFPSDRLVELEVGGLDGTVRRETRRRLSYTDYVARLRGGTRYRNFSDDDAISVSYPADGVAVLNVETLVNYRTPVEPAAVLDPVFVEIRERGAHTLILDLRRNGGGSTDAQQGLMSYLVSEPHQPVLEVRAATYDLSASAEYISTWDRSALTPDPAWFTAREDGLYTIDPDIIGASTVVQPAANGWTGELAVLTSSANASGAATIIGALKEQGRATLIGEETGGSQEGPTANIIFFLVLPESDITVRVPAQWTIQNVTDPVPGRGFDPDIAAPLTYETWFAGTDPALESALQWAQNQR